MPTLLNETRVQLEWGDINGRIQPLKQHPGTRTSGVHLSGIIKHVLLSLNMLTPFEANEDEMPLRMGMGMAWEDWVVGLHRASSDSFVWQPGELELDGVYASPDGLNCLDMGDGNGKMLVLEEFKLTWKSRQKYAVDKPITQQALWMWQLAGYCHMLNIQRARLHVCWVNGDYRPPSPDYRIYTIGFEPEELEGFWGRVVLPNKAAAKPE